jgi:hypothetical protein
MAVLFNILAPDFIITDSAQQRLRLALISAIKGLSKSRT